MFRSGTHENIKVVDEICLLLLIARFRIENTTFRGFPKMYFRLPRHHVHTSGRDVTELYLAVDSPRSPWQCLESAWPYLLKFWRYRGKSGLQSTSSSHSPSPLQLNLLMFLFLGQHLNLKYLRLLSLSQQAVWLWSNPHLAFESSLCASVLAPTITNPDIDLQTVCECLLHCFSLLGCCVKEVKNANSDGGQQIGNGISVENCTRLCQDRYPYCVAVDYRVIDSACYFHTSASCGYTKWIADVNRYSVHCPGT